MCPFERGHILKDLADCRRPSCCPWHCHWQKTGCRSLHELCPRGSTDFNKEQGTKSCVVLTLETKQKIYFLPISFLPQFLILVLKVTTEVPGDKDIHYTLKFTLICSLHFMILFVEFHIHILKKILSQGLLQDDQITYFYCISFHVQSQNLFCFSLMLKNRIS